MHVLFQSPFTPRSSRIVHQTGCHGHCWAARRGKTQRFFSPGGGYVYPHLNDIHDRNYATAWMVAGQQVHVATRVWPQPSRQSIATWHHDGPAGDAGDSAEEPIWSSYAADVVKFKLFVLLSLQVVCPIEPPRSDIPADFLSICKNIPLGTRAR